MVVRDDVCDSYFQICRQLLRAKPLGPAGGRSQTPLVPPSPTLIIYKPATARIVYTEAPLKYETEHNIFTAGQDDLLKSATGVVIDHFSGPCGAVGRVYVCPGDNF